MFTFCIIMIVIASILLILAVLVQSPKSGMAANFGAANQTMGVRQTSDFLEKFTWAMVAAVVFFSLLSVIVLPKNNAAAVVGADHAVAGAQAITTPAEEAVVEEDILVEADAEAETVETVEAEVVE